MIERQVIDGQPATVVYFKPGMVPGTKLDHSLVKLVFDNGIVQFLAPKKDVRTADDFDPNEARDPEGKWTSSGGGSASSVKAPAESKVPESARKDRLIKSMLDRGAYRPVIVGRSDTDWKDLEFHPKEHPNAVPFHSGRKDQPDKVAYYDPRYAELKTVDEDEPILTHQIAVPKPGIAEEIEPLPDKDAIYRGISAEEYDEIQRSGEVKSRGEYNIGDEQRGLTYWTTDPGMANSYANGFAPQHLKPTFTHPAYVIATHKPEETRNVKGTGSEEVGVARSIKKEELIGIWRGDPYAYRPAGFSLRPEGTVSGGNSPLVDLVWTRIDKKTGDAFDPNEARDPKGRWTSSGGVGRKGEESTVSFVSPNTEVRNLSFSEAEQGLKSPRQKMLAGISHKIDSDLGIKDIRINHVIGAWSDGAENSVMTNSASTDLQVERVAAAAKAFLANQKAVLLFHPDKHGTDFLAQFRITGKLSEIHESLLKAGIEHHTLEPRGPDVVVHVYGSDKETLANVSKAAKSYDAKITVHPGNGEFIGTTKEDGTDAEQRADARAIYEKIISEGMGSAGKLSTEWRSQWENYIDNWERTTGEKIGRVEYRKPKSESGGEGGGTSGTGGTAKSDEAQRSAEKAASGKPRLEGLPAQPIKLGDNYYIPAPLKKASDAAESYMKSAGLEYNPPKQYLPVDTERAERIAKAYDEMKHDPDDPEVKAAYAALAKETMAQWQAIKKTGLKVEWIKEGSSGDPYVEKLELIRRDVRENNHVWEFPTDLGYGSEGPTDDHNNPMLQPTDEVIDGKKCVVNDIFRIVHDYFGHFKEDVGFSDDGEENAWRSHMAMYSPLARRAATTETRGQASWVNHGPYGNQNYGAEPGDIHYAPQKIGLLPEWCSNEGREDKTKDAFDPNQKRDESGRWTSGGGITRYHEVKREHWEAAKKRGYLDSDDYEEKRVWTSTHPAAHYVKMYGGDPNKYSGIDPGNVELKITLPKHRFREPPGGGTGDRVTKGRIPISAVEEHVNTKDRRWKLFHLHTRDGVFTLRLRDKYDPNEPRDPSGKWTEGGGSPRKTEELPPSSSAPKEVSKPDSVKVRHDNGDIEQVKLPDDVVQKARQLQDDPEKYFKISNDADMIPVDKLVQTRARPEGVAHAVDLMAAAYKGEGGKRGPIHVQKLEDGHYLVLDGNSTTTIATAAGWEHLPAIVIPDASYLPKKPLKNSDGHPGLISTALPKGKASEFNQPSLALAKSDPKSFGLHIQVYKDNPTAYPLTKEQLSGSDEEVARHVIDHIKSNLRYIYEHTPEAQRNRTAKWYDGARKMVDEHVKTYKDYGMRDTTVAGVYASLSPNNLWDQNVEQGDRMIDIYCKHRQEPWDKKMDDAVAKISNKTIKKAALSIAGKSYDELDSPSKKGLWIRIYDQSRWPESPTYKSYTKNKPAIQPFHKVTPEGERQEWYLTKKGVPQSLSWQSMAMMAKAVRILESKGDRDVISKALKGSTPTHKVRSFYNNILDPNSPNKDVTMDTHAIDAAWLMDDPIAVLHNFGNTPQKKGRPAAWVKGTPGSVKTGIGGNYSFNAEAYRELADDLKIQPRQLQSIIWETKREWMVDMTEDNNKRVQDTWEQYRQGNLTQSQAQDKVKQIVDEDLALTPAKRKEIARAKSKAKREAKKAAAA